MPRAAASYCRPTLPFGTPFMEPVDDSLDNLLPLLNDYQDTWQARSASTGRSRRCTPRCA